MIFLLFLLIGTSISTTKTATQPDPGFDPEAYLSYEEELRAGIDAFYDTDWQKAEAIFNRLIIQDPRDPQPYFFLAMMPFWEYFLVEQSEKKAEQFLVQSESALERSRTRLEDSPGDTTMVLMLSGLHGYRSLVAAGEGNYRVAIQSGMTGFQFTRQLLALDTNRADARIGRGVFYYMMGSVPKGLKWATNITGFRGDMEQGFEELKRAANSKSYVSTDAKMILMYLYNKEQRYDEAIAYAEKLTSDLPRNVIFKYKKAEIYENAGNKNLARELFAEVAASGNSNLPRILEMSRQKAAELSD